MATIYRIRFNNVEEQEIQCTLTDETGDLDIIDVQGAEDAIRIVSQDNDESKYSPIKAKKCVIKFLNSLSVNVRTFSTGEDSKWLVEVKINSLRVFIGHLEQGDIEEPFQYESNQIVVLTATDGLGVLKTHRLEDIYNAWSGSGGGCGASTNRIIDYIAACLGATGLQLTINVINNLREIDNPSTDPTTFGNIYAALYLNIKTFEDQKIGQYTNCYEILEKILGHDCYLTQAKGEWWIIRVTELRCDFNMSRTIFDFNGDVLSFETLNYEKAIGLKDVNNTPFGTPDATAFFSQENTMLALQRPVKSVSLRYQYENPFEILNNSTLQRGDFITDLPDELDPDGNTLTVKAFETECWIFLRNVPPDTQDSVEYTKVLYNAGTAANLSVWLVLLPYDSTRTGSASHTGVVTHGWADIQNYKSLTKGGNYASKLPGEKLVPGKFYDLTFDLEPTDEFIPAGKRLGVMVFSSDREFTLWPKPGTELTLDLGKSSFSIPIVGGTSALAKAGMK